MRSVALSLLLLATVASVGCQSKAEKVNKLLDQYNAEYPAYAKDCLDETSGSARMLTGEELTAEQTAALEAKKRAIAMHRTQTTALINDDPAAFRLSGATIARLTGPTEYYWRSRDASD